jgi:hypothetical protein
VASGDFDGSGNLIVQASSPATYYMINVRTRVATRFTVTGAATGALARDPVVHRDRPPLGLGPAACWCARFGQATSLLKKTAPDHAPMLSR